MGKTEVRRASEKAPGEIACGTGYSWNFKKAGSTRWRKTSWDAGTEAGDLVEDFNKSTESAAKRWVRAVKCVGPCPGGATCSKGIIRIGPPVANGDRNTWVPEYDRDYDSCRIYVEVSCRATVVCYCGRERPNIREGGTEVL